MALQAKKSFFKKKNNLLFSDREDIFKMLRGKQYKTAGDDWQRQRRI